MKFSEVLANCRIIRNWIKCLYLEGCYEMGSKIVGREACVTLFYWSNSSFLGGLLWGSLVLRLCHIIVHLSVWLVHLHTVLLLRRNLRSVSFFLPKKIFFLLDDKRYISMSASIKDELRHYPFCWLVSMLLTLLQQSSLLFVICGTCQNINNQPIRTEA